MSVRGPQRSEYQGREHSEAVEDEKAEATIARWERGRVQEPQERGLKGIPDSR